MALDQVAFSDKIGDDICAALLYVFFMYHLCLICSSHVGFKVLPCLYEPKIMHVTYYFWSLSPNAI